mmetsp:Transcript_33226/g.53358  ORF Transcript_33226/g.53358 Transcript_33226/m.53358 type:complete len:721 (-) Transcript_33226:165-2327(-)
MLTQRLLADSGKAKNDTTYSSMADRKPAPRLKSPRDDDGHVDVQCSGMFCCGRWWYVSPFEFLLPSLCLGLLRSPVVVWAGLLWLRAGMVSGGIANLHEACGEQEYHVIRFLGATCVFYSLSYLLFAFLACATCFRNSAIVHTMVYLKSMFLVFDAFWSSLGCYLLHGFPVDNPCFPSRNPKAIYVCATLCVTLGFLSTILDLWFIRTVYNPSSTRYTCWSSLCWWILCPCCWQQTSDFNFSDNPNIFNDMAEHVRRLFGGVRGVTLSDVAYSLTLVAKVQSQKKTSYLKPDALRIPLDSTDVTSDEKSTGNAEIRLEVRSTQQGLEQEPYSMVELLEKGIQPKLLLEDWETLAEIRYYLHYATGACGWPMYLYLYPCSCFSLCGCYGTFAKESVGDTCCHSNERAFSNNTGVDPEDILIASMVVDLERLHYYVAVDRKRSQVVIAIRGTMSFQDLATDARQKYVPIWDESEHLLPEGFLKASRRILREVRRSLAVKSFLESHPDYGLVLTGHSLGAACAIVSTILLDRDPTWNRPVKAVAMAPPPIVDRKLANDERWKDLIFCLVFRDDIVPRMSLHNLFRLRSQALETFRKCSNPSTDIFKNFVDELKDIEVNRYQTVDFPHVQREVIDEKSVPPLVIPGRVYHLLRRPHSQRGCSNRACHTCRHYGGEVEYETVVYPAAPETFSEIRVSGSMFLDHFPHRYVRALDGIGYPAGVKRV